MVRESSAIRSCKNPVPPLLSAVPRNNFYEGTEMNEVATPFVVFVKTVKDGRWQVRVDKDDQVKLSCMVVVS